MEFECQHGVQNPWNIVSSRVKLGQVALKLVQVGSKLGQVGVSDASLDVEVHKICFPALLERNMAQHSANMARNPPTMEAHREGPSSGFSALFRS